MAICGVCAAALVLNGCSAGNLTGFDFPAFGLLKKKDPQDDAWATSSVNAGKPAKEEQLGTR